MKKLLTLTALFAAVSGISAETTSTKKIDVKNQSFMERVGGYYYTVLSKGLLSSEDQSEPDSAWLNYLNASYKLSKDTSISTTLRFEVVDSNSGDRFNELDQRVAISSKIYNEGMFSAKAYMTVELPTSRNSQDDDRIMRLKPAVALTTKFDDYNTLMTYGGFNKTMYNSANNSIADTERHYYSTWIVFTNKYISEKYVLKAEYSSTLSHVAGTSDLTIRKDENDELNLGVEFNIAGFDINPYIVHGPSGLKASNTLGGGVQVFKPF